MIPEIKHMREKAVKLARLDALRRKHARLSNIARHLAIKKRADLERK